VIKSFSRALKLIAASVLFAVQPAAANDLPVKGNLAAQTEMAIERGVNAGGDEPETRMHVFSIFASKLAWPSSTLRVCFWNGTPQLRAQVAGIADELTQTLPIKFAWRNAAGQLVECPGFNDPAKPWKNYPVRVSLVAAPAVVLQQDDPTAFFAMVGTQNDGGRLATINLPFDGSFTQERIRWKTLHEFCHVLGCLHEFQRDICTVDFNEAWIRAHFGLTATEYQENFLAVPSSRASGPAATTFDPTSVMMYELTADYFKANSHNICMTTTINSALSALDISGLQNAYASRGTLLNIDDFPALAQTSHNYAQALRERANGLRVANSRWVTESIGLGTDTSADATRIEGFAVVLDRKAAKAEVEAKSYSLTPAQEAAIRLALSYFPKD
jgi:hypothetical protein